MQIQLYLHFPFCKRKCFYCDFCSSAQSDETIAAYCAAMVSELRRAGESMPDCEVSTVYLGGGTPSIVPAKNMADVLDALQSGFRLQKGAEFTTEANPGTLEQGWLQAVMKRGVNRLSLGMQASQGELLRSLGRIHTHEQTCESVRVARACGISNLNLDLMYALPGQTAADYLQSVDAVCALAPQHISAYSLILEENTPLYDRVQRGEIVSPNDDEAAEMSGLGAERLAQNGYRQYEISNYAREGFACRHNVGYWQGAWYMGLGLAAHGMLPPTPDEAGAGARYARQANTDKLDEYIARNGDAIATRQPIGSDEAMFETMMLGLRMNEGVDERNFERRHGVSLRQRYGAACDSLVTDGLGLWENGCFRLTARGLLLQNTALMRLME